MKHRLGLYLIPLLVLALALAPALFALPALAATAAVVAAEPTFWPMALLFFNSTAGMAAVAIGLWLFSRWLRIWIAAKGLEGDERVRSYVLPLLDLIVSAAFARLGPIGLLASVAPGASAEVLARRQDAERFAVDYVESRVPGGIEHFGLTPEALREMVAVRMDAQAAELMKPKIPSPILVTPAG